MTNLTDFIEKHATPYNPESDTYRRPPFAQSIKAGKNSPIYNAHSYHTKVPPTGIVPYIEHYTSPGDLILDPFCGSGMTGVAALMTGRHAILNDLSPAAVHIASNYTTPVDVNALTQEFNRIKIAVKEEFDWLYGTTCDRCSGPATIQYTVWSDIFECDRCGNEIVLWDVAVDRDSRKVYKTFQCPTCQAEWQKTDLQWLYSVPVITNYECQSCKPKRAEHATTKAEKVRIAEIEASEIPYWHPTTPFDSSWEMWRGVHRTQNITDVIEIEQRVVEQVADFLTTNPPLDQRTLQYLWNHVLYDMLRDGSVEASMADVEEMLAYHYQTFKQVDGRYYLRGESVMYGWQRV